MTKENNVENLTLLAPALLGWYDREARILPWRMEATPYGVWVSEIMLQQTQVVTVIPYFLRFMATLPSVADLAKVDEGVLTKLWEGLGYYNRVRNMHRAALMVMGDFGGQLPGEYQQLLTLPGIGEYTAGAIASIAYGQRVPAVDGNVMRVFARLLASDLDLAYAKNKKWFQEMVTLALPGARVGDFNQSLMELGATICLPKAEPHCQRCPIGDYCQAYLRGEVVKYPVKSAKKPRKIEERTILVIVAEGKVWLTQRSMKGLLPGLWSFYNLEGHLNQGEIEALLVVQGLAPLGIEAVGEAKHIFTHLEWRMVGWVIEVEACIPWEKGVWADLTEVEDRYALPRAFRAYTGQLGGWIR